MVFVIVGKTKRGTFAQYRRARKLWLSDLFGL
jgi:hypothetical protein